MYAATPAERDEARLASLDHSPDGFLWLAADGAILDFNQTLLERLEYPRDELLAKRIFDLQPPLTEDEWEALKARLEDEGSVVFECDYVKKSEEKLPVEVSAGRIDHRGEQRYLCIARDVGDLRQEARILRGFVEHTPASVAIVDREMRYVRVSRRWIEDYDVGVAHTGELIGRSHYDFFPDVPERWREIHRRGMEGEVMSAEGDRYDRADGTTEWIDWEVRPWHENDGRVGGIVMFTEVITEKKKRREELEQKRQELFRAQKMEAVGRLAGGIAHDFNNLLSVILGFAELLEKRWADEPSAAPEGSEDLREVIRAAERAAELTHQLLAYSRREILVPRPVDLAAYLSEMRPMLRRLLRESIELGFDLGDPLPPVYMDPGYLGQVVMNLVINASDAMPEGGLLTLETREDDGDALLIVEDTGEGIPPEDLDRIFEPFYSTKDVGEGTGLGLSTVIGIVEQSGGRIRVESEPGEGSRFYVHLPAAGEEKVEETIVETEAAPPAPTDCTVLLVEDEEVLRSLVRRCLVEAGYQVLDAGDGPQALELLRGREEQISLLLTDLVLPGFDGKELARRVLADRGSEGRAKIPVVFMTGYSDELPNLERMREAMHVELIRKPVRLQSLLETVAGALGTRC